MATMGERYAFDDVLPVEDQALVPLSSSHKVHYSPSTRYIRENLAPEIADLSAVVRLGRAARAAAEGGLISPEQMIEILGTVMVEGRWGDYGSNGLSTPRSGRLGASRVIEAALSKAGHDSRGVDQTTFPNHVPPLLPGGETTYYSPASRNFGEYYDDNTYGRQYLLSDDPAALAAIAVASFAEKARVYGRRAAIERWNGTGPAAKIHAKKVREAISLIGRPENAALRSAFFKG